jgi:hypothetical protein
MRLIVRLSGNKASLVFMIKSTLAALATLQFTAIIEYKAHLQLQLKLDLPPWTSINVSRFTTKYYDSAI